MKTHEGVTTGFDQRQPAARADRPRAALVRERAVGVAACEAELEKAEVALVVFGRGGEQSASDAKSEPSGAREESVAVRESVSAERRESAAAERALEGAEAFVEDADGARAAKEKGPPENETELARHRGERAGTGGERDAGLARDADRSARVGRERGRLDAEVEARESRVSRVSGALDPKKTAAAQRRIGPVEFEEASRDARGEEFDTDRQESRIEELMRAFDSANERLADGSGMLAMTGPKSAAAISMLADLWPLLEALAGLLPREERAEFDGRSARS